MPSKKKPWHFSERSRKSTGALLSGVNELFHPAAQNAHEVIEKQNQRGVDHGSEGDPLKITLKLPPKEI